MSMEERLYAATKRVDIEEVTELVAAPSCDVNWVNPSNPLRLTALHLACSHGFVAGVRALLRRADLNVNISTRTGTQPFLLACHGNQVEIVKLMVADIRVDLTAADTQGRFPLWWAVTCGHVEVAEWLVASRAPLLLDRGVIARKTLRSLSTSGDDLGKQSCQLVKNLCEAPERTRHEIRLRLKVTEILVPTLFAAVVLLCDGYLVMKAGVVSSLLAAPTEAATTAAAAERFLKMAVKLPMELQMLLCHRVFGSTKQNVTANDLEPAVRVWLAWS